MPSLALTPRGHLLFDREGETSISGLASTLESAFGRGSGHGLLELGATEVGTLLPADLAYWRDFAARFVTALCAHPSDAAPEAFVAAPPEGELAAFAAAAPPMTGAEYLTSAVLQELWAEIAAAFRLEF